VSVTGERGPGGFAEQTSTAAAAAAATAGPRATSASDEIPGTRVVETPVAGTIDPNFLPPTATALPPSGLTLELVAPGSTAVGTTAEAQVRIVGSGAPRVGAFNFDLVYDQTQIVLETPQANQALLDATGREFRCDLPPPSGDIEPAPDVGRARLVCFSFGDAGQDGFPAPATIATIRVRPLVSGNIALQWERVAFYTAGGATVGSIERAPATVHAQ
jgi:hypothetical protein